MYISSSPSETGCDTRSICKPSTAGSNSEFSFSKTSCQIKTKEPSLLNYIPINDGRKDGFMPLPRARLMARVIACSPGETRVQYQVESYQRLKKWYLMLPCLTLSIIRYGSRVKWSNPGKGVAPFPTPRWVL